MLVLLGMLIAVLASLALAPLLWARAARVTTERVQQDVHSAAFNEASDHVSRKYEGKLAEREGALKSEIEQLEASREKISAEASSRVSALEETRTNLEQEIATRDAQLAESDRLFKALAENVSSLGARADALGREAADLGSRAEALSTEITGLGASHEEIARSLHPEAASDAPPAATAAAISAPALPAPVAPTTVSQDEPALAEPEDPAPAPPVPAPQIAATVPEPAGDKAEEETPQTKVPSALTAESSLSDRIRALRDGVSA